MGWQEQANRMSMGQFISVKQDMMVLFTFDGEPVLARGKNFKKEEVDELQFPAIFYDIRAVKDRYAEGEPLEIIRKGKGESKVFPVQGGPKLRCIMEEDAIEPIVGRTFIMSHTGNATNTVYKLREVLVPKKPRAQRLPVADEEEEEAEAIPEKAAQDKAREKKMRTPGDDPLETDAERAAKVDAKVKAPATKRRASKATITVPEEDNESIAPKFDSEGHVLPEGKSDEEDTEKAKFMKEVAKRTAKRTKKPVAQDPPDEPDLEQEEEPDQEEE